MAEDKPSDIIFPVSTLNIKLDTNVGEAEYFKRSMIKLPKMDEPPKTTSDTPFFTKYVRYPGYIENADWKTRFEFFFDRDKFVETLRTEILADSSIFKKPEDIDLENTAKKENDKNANDPEKEKKEKKKSKKKKRKDKSGDEWLLYTEKQNIMITLRSLFPIAEKFGTALKNSFDHVLMKNVNSRILYDLNFLQSLNFFGFMYKFGIIKKEEEEYFVNLKGKRYEIQDAMWENDIVNHPAYSAFLKAQNNTFQEVIGSRFEVKKKLESHGLELVEEFNTLIERSRIKEEYIWDVFKDKLIEKFGKDRDFPSDKDKNAFVGYFEKKIRNFDDDEFDDYIYADSGKQNIDSKLKAKLTEDSNENTPSDEDLIINTWENVKQELKSKETITGLLQSLQYHKNTIDKSKDSATIVLIDRVTENLKSLPRNAIGKLNPDAKDILSKYNANAKKILQIEFDLSSIRGFTPDYNSMIKKLKDISIHINTTSIVYEFVNDNKPMELNPVTEDSKEKREDDAVKQEIINYIRKNYPNEYNWNAKLTNSVNEICEPKRKTSNSRLYCLLRYIKMSKPSPGCEDSDDVKVFNRIYNYYMVKYPERNSLSIIEPFLYTGVDQVSSAESDENQKAAANKSQEIYVRLELVDADKMETANHAECGLYDKVVTEQYKYLTDKLYTDGTVLSTFRNLDFFSNPLIDVVAKQMDQANTQGKMAAGYRTMRSRRGHTRRINDTVSSKKTLRRR